MIKIDFFKLTPRLGRIEHLGLFSFWLSIIVLGVFLDEIIPNHFAFTIIPAFILIFVALINIIFLKIRRLNDFNFSGWWLLLGGIPLLGACWVLAIFCIPGTNRNNQFGNQPSNPSSWHYLLVLATPLMYFILYLLGFYDLT